MGLGLAGAAKTPVFFWKLAWMNILTILQTTLASGMIGTPRSA
jgi:hypothetical protein